jgi:hypothetical protein
MIDRGENAKLLRTEMKGARLKIVAAIVVIVFGLGMGCSNENLFNILLVADKSKIRPDITWSEVRNYNSALNYGVRISDTNGFHVALFRFNHDDSSIIPLEDTYIHVSTPIIIEKKYKSVVIHLTDRSGAEISNFRVVISELKILHDDRAAFLIPIDFKALNGKEEK